jgi:hypothetical protein
MFNTAARAIKHVHPRPRVSMVVARALGRLLRAARDAPTSQAIPTIAEPAAQAAATCFALQENARPIAAIWQTARERASTS